jgi:hypothetical protein
MKKLSPALQKLALTDKDREYLLAIGSIGYQPEPLHGNAGPRAENSRHPRKTAKRENRDFYTEDPAHAAKFDRHLRRHFASITQTKLP